MLKDSLELMKIKENLTELMKEVIPKRLHDKLPSGYSVIGDIAILRHLSPELDRYKTALGDQIISVDVQVQTVIEQTDTISSFRKPVIIHLAGVKRTVTKHKEFGTIFNIDLANITFSPGNKGERSYLIQTVENYETVCDMFSCIGNLSLPICVNNETVKVYGVEINPEAYNFLLENIKENKVEHIYFPILGDNRIETPKNIATRVLMGYFGIDEIQFITAIESVKQEGWIHFHDLVQRDTYMQKNEVIENVLNETRYNVVIKNTRRIKKYSPRQIHVCYDIYVNKQ